MSSSKNLQGALVNESASPLVAASLQVEGKGVGFEVRAQLLAVDIVGRSLSGTDTSRGTLGRHLEVVGGECG